MDILITMIYTAAMTLIATKVIEHTPTTIKSSRSLQIPHS